MIFYPPKPRLITVTQPLFEQLERDNRVVAELKFKGDRLVLKRMVDGSFEFWNRHGSKFDYTPSPELLKNLRSLDWIGDCICDGELLHKKTRHIKHHIVLWDVFVWDGKSLKSKVWAERRAYLERLFGGRRFGNLWISDIWRNDWKTIFKKEIPRNEVEGLVMKRMDAKLILGYTSSPVVPYMWKVRKPEGLYKF